MEEEKQGESLPIEKITLGGKIFPHAAAYLQEHGCRVVPAGDDATIIEYPKGTTRQELYPRTVDIRYRVIFPDGQELREIVNRITNRSLLSGPWRA